MSTITRNAASPSTRVLFSAVSSVDRAVIALRRRMDELGYARSIIREVAEIAFREKALISAADQNMIDPDDLAGLTDCFVEAFDPVSPVSKKWDLPAGVWVTAGDVEPAPVAPQPDPVADGQAYARMMGRHDVRSRPTIEDWKEYQRFQDWHGQSYVAPDVLECEAAEIGRPFNRA